jgi:hypothetical protein
MLGHEYHKKNSYPKNPHILNVYKTQLLYIFTIFFSKYHIKTFPLPSSETVKHGDQKLAISFREITSRNKLTSKYLYTRKLAINQSLTQNSLQSLLVSLERLGSFHMH